MPAKLLKKNGNRYTLDVRNYTCPYPEFYTAKIIDSLSGGQTVEVILDSPPACDAIPRLVELRNCKVIETLKLNDGGWKIVIEKPLAILGHIQKV
jgi:tRNA 2-thiouridine synthesizing protein A